MLSQTEAVRGNERIQQLMEAFPEAKRYQVLLVELDTQGIRPNETTRQLGRWALPDAPSYFERNKEAIFKTAERSEMGYYLNPFTCHFGDGTNLRIAFDTKSPYEIRYEERGRYRIYGDGEPIEEVFFPPRPQWYDRRTSSGKPMASVVSASSEGTLLLAALTYCEYWKDGNGCRYCNINSSNEVSKEAGLARQTAKQEQDVYETTLAACQENKIISFILSGGVILDPSKEADMYARLIKAQRRAEKDAGYGTPIPIMAICQAMEPEDTLKLKEAGATILRFNLEVWDPKLFEWLCPGKAKYVGRERWLERLVQAVEVFGEQLLVQSNFVPGVELAPPHGFKTEDEGAESYLEGCKWMLDHGIEPTSSTWRPAPYTMFEGLPSPRTEYVLRLQLAQSAMCTKYNMADPAKRFEGRGLQAGPSQDVCQA